MPASEPTRDDDLRILKILDARAHDGLSLVALSERFGGNSAAISRTLAVIRTEDAGVVDVCSRPECMDGGMPRRWWLGSN